MAVSDLDAMHLSKDSVAHGLIAHRPSSMMVGALAVIKVRCSLTSSTSPLSGAVLNGIPLLLNLPLNCHLAFL